jgi:purine-binding chemotaxis protein CheW
MRLAGFRHDDVGLRSRMPGMRKQFHLVHLTRPEASLSQLPQQGNHRAARAEARAPPFAKGQDVGENSEQRDPLDREHPAQADHRRADRTIGRDGFQEPAQAWDVAGVARLRRITSRPASPGEHIRPARHERNAGKVHDVLRIAEMTTPASHAETRTQYLGFALNGSEYAVNLLRVKEIIEYDALTRVPAMPESVRGVINLRGKVIPVVDLAARFGLPEGSITRRTCIVIVECADGDGSIVMGIITDAVIEVLDLLDSEIEPAPSFGARIDTEFIAGMAERGRKFVIILNVDRCLDAATLCADVVPA